MNCSTEIAKRINLALRREGFKVKGSKDARGKFWIIGDEEAVTILEYWFSPTGLLISPTRADRSCPYLQEWSFVRCLIRAIQAENFWINDLLRNTPTSKRRLEVVQ